MKLWDLVSLATMFVISINANAVIISTDWMSAGDNLITHDTESNLNWLDLTETTGLSYNYVNDQLDAGGQFAGYRFATDTEVIELWSNFGVDLSATAQSSSTVQIPGVEAAVSFIGNVSNEASPIYPFGAIGMISISNDLIFQNYLGAYQHSEGTILFTNVGYGLRRTSGSYHVGSYLVSEVSPVPVPAAVWLFGSGLIGLVGFATRKKD